MSNKARRFGSATDALDFGTIPWLNGVPSFALAFRFALASDALDFPLGQPAKMIASMIAPDGSEAAFQLYYAAGGALHFGAFDGHGNAQQWMTTSDVLKAGGVPLAGFHTLALLWAAVDADPLTFTFSGKFTLWIDGARVATAVTFIPNPRMFGDQLATTTAPLRFGAMAAANYIAAGWGGMAGLTLDDIGFWTTLTDDDDDALAFALGPPYTPAEVFRPATLAPLLLEALAIDGTSPEVGLNGTTTASGGIHGTTVVDGPEEYPPQQATCALSQTTVHVNGTIAIAGSWLHAHPAAGAVAFTLAPTSGSFDAASYTLTSSSGSTFAATLTAGPAIGAYSIGVSNDGGLAPQVFGFNIAKPTVGVARAWLIAEGNVAVAWFEQLDPVTGLPNGVPVAITGAVDGGTIDADGQPPVALRTPVTDGTSNMVWWPLGDNDIQIIDVLAGGFATTGGSWSTLTIDPGSANLRLWWGDHLRKTTDVAATGVFAFTGLTPGVMYVASINKPFNDLFHAPRWTTGNSTAVRWTGTDGTTTTHFDQDQTGAGTHDRNDLGAHWMDLFTFTPAGTTYTITAANFAGAGIMLLPAARIERLQSRTPIHGGNDALRTWVSGTPAIDVSGSPVASVTLRLPDALLAGGGDSNGPQTVVCTVKDRASFFPFDADLPRTMTVSYVQGGISGGTSMCQPYANKINNSAGWSNAQRDAGNSITGIAAGATASCPVTAAGLPDGLHLGFIFGTLTAPDGRYRVQYDTTPDLDLTPHFTDSDSVVGGMGAPTGPGPTHDPSSGHFDWFFTIVFPPLDRYASHTLGMTLHLTNATGADAPVTNVQVHDALIPLDWTHPAHPLVWNTFHATGIDCIRNLDRMAINGSGIRTFDDWEPLKVIDSTFCRTLSVPIASITPCDTVGNTDGVNGWFRRVHAQGVFTVTTTIPHELVSGITPRIKTGPFTYSPDVDTNVAADASSTGTIEITSPKSIIVLSDTEFLALSLADQNETNGSLPAVTIAAAVPGASSWHVVLVPDDQVCSAHAFVAQQVALGIGSWFGLPHAFYQVDTGRGEQALADQSIRQTVALLRDQTAAGQKTRLACSNELWNGNGNVTAATSQVLYVDSLAVHFGVSHDTAAGIMVAHVLEVCWDEWTNPTIASIPYPDGRDPADLILVVEDQYGSPGRVVNAALGALAADGKRHIVGGTGGAVYVSNIPRRGNFADPAPLAFLRMDARALVYTMWLSVRYTGIEVQTAEQRSLQVTNGLTAARAAHALPAPELNSYEGIWERFNVYLYGNDRDNQVNHAAFFLPETFDLTRSLYQLLQGLGYGCVNRFTFDSFALLAGFGTNNLYGGSLWRDIHGIADTAGTGADTENPVHGDPRRDRRSESLGGALAFSLSSTVPPPPPPPPPPLSSVWPRDGAYLGRFPRGQSLPLSLVTPAAAEAVVYRIYGGGVLVASGTLADVPDPDEPARAAGTRRLASGFAPGFYQVVYQYVHDGTVRGALDTFDVLAGGDPAGPVVAGVALAAAEQDRALLQLGGGVLALARGPYLDEGID